MSAPLLGRLGRAPFSGYLYAYPHKTAYRTLEPPISLDEAWAEESRTRLFLYIHVPFCSSRCGYCNLFSTTSHDAGVLDAFVAAVARQARRVARTLGPSRSFSRFAAGGGTPSLLGAKRLAALFDVAEELLATGASTVPTSVELAPATTTPALVELLQQRGIERVSIGVQAFDPGTLRALGRGQRVNDAARALKLIHDAGFPSFNVDLMYGADGQDIAAWVATVEAALEYSPDELYLYPLYVRPLTALGRAGRTWDDHRLECYAAGRDLLVGRGFIQRSYRHFARPRREQPAAPYRCQEDGMIGLGPGARSYTRALHYSSEYAVGSAAARTSVDGYLEASEDDHGWIRHGIRLAPEEQRRRFVIKSLLHSDGLDLEAYAARFGTSALSDLTELGELVLTGLAERSQEGIRLTARGLELSDAIGPWLVSEPIRERMAGHRWR